MATDYHLPPAVSDEVITALLTSLSLPKPSSIEALQVAAAFHSIYLLTFPLSAAPDLQPATARNSDGSIDLVLRLSGNHITRKKTVNEVAVMRWIKENTEIPVPAVVRFDATTDNPVGCEFTLLEKIPGRSVDKFYHELSEDAKMALVRQLTDVVVEMNRHDWTHVGGLQINKDGDIVPGPVLEDTFWFNPDIEQYWGHDESVETLNPSGPYGSHAELVEAYLNCFIHAINTHPSLSWLQDMTPRLTALIALLPSLPLSTTRLVLAHKDLHFANIIALPDGTITGILDWEFAGVVPILRWDPVRAFLWNAQRDDESAPEKERMRGLFEEELKRRGVEKWYEGVGDVQEVWNVIKFVRALVEVGPKGEMKERVGGWRNSTEEALAKLGL